MCLKAPNKVACDILNCDLASKKKNITPASVLAVFLDIGIPVIVSLLFFGVLLAFPASAIISSLFSLSFFATLMVILGGNILMLIVGGILLLILGIVLWVMLFSQIGIYALIPLGMAGLAFLLGLIPVIGGIISFGMRLVPWTIVAVVIYWIENADAGLKFKPLFERE